MSKYYLPSTNPWGLSYERYFYYFMGLRKGELTKDMAMLREQYPDDDTHQLARRVVKAQAPLSLLGGAVLHVPLLIPSVSPVLKFLGIATGTAVMVILNMTMLLSIALLYGHDIYDRARLKEMFVIVLASGVAGGSSLLPYVNTLKLNQRALIGGASVMTVSQLIGEAAIRYYRKGPAKQPDTASTQASSAPVQANTAPVQAN